MSARASQREGAAVRAAVRGRVQGVGFREATVRRARDLGLLGWVRNEDDGGVRVHAEGSRAGVDGLLAFLAEGPPGARVEAVESEAVKVEGHEQFAVRGVSAGAFAVIARGPGGGYELRLEVGNATRAWALPKEPTLDPAQRRLAVELAEPGAATAAPAPPAVAWDRGEYEQGGRVAWPEALERGHAVFVLHGERLRGGFALQRTAGGDAPRWLLVKRRDRWAEGRAGGGGLPPSA